MPAVYILRCADQSYYTGSTVNLPQRIEQHASGLGPVWTRSRLPVTLVWYSEFARIDEAYAWEKRIHGWSRAKKELLIAERYDELPGWSVRERRARTDSAD